MDDSALDAAILGARAAVLADLTARDLAVTESVSLLEEACSQRRWWLSQWPAGAVFVGGLIAQDVQDGLADQFGRDHPLGLWPVCSLHAEHRVPVHALHIDPDLGGPDPQWICEEVGTAVAPLGRLP